MFMQSLGAVGRTAVRATPDVASAEPGFNVGWQLLTADDWKVMSALAGHEVKPGGAIPLAGADLLDARRNGFTGQFSASFFTSRLSAPGQPAEIREQLERGLAYVSERDAVNARRSSSYLDAPAGRVNLYA
jgi:hypothetical protein